MKKIASLSSFLLTLVILLTINEIALCQTTQYHAGKKVRISITPPIYPVDVDNAKITYNSQDNHYLIVWQKELAGQAPKRRIEGKIINGTKPVHTVVKTFPIAAHGDLNNPSVAYNPDENIYFVIWERIEKIPQKPHGSYFKHHLEGRAIDKSGKVLGNNIINFNREGRSPVTLYDAKNKAFLIIYEYGEKLYGIWEPSSSAQVGATTSANYFDLGTDTFANESVKACQPDVAYGSKGSYLIVFDAEYSIEGTEHSGILGTWLSNKLGPTTRLFQIGVYLPPGARWYGAHNPSVAFNANRNKFVAVWEDTRDYTNPHDNYAIYGSVIDLDSETNLTKNFKIAERLSSVNRERPQIAFDDANNLFLVIWDQKDIYGQFIGLQGLKEKAFPIADAKRIQKKSALTFNWKTKNYFIIWTDLKNDSQPDIYGHRIKF